MAGRPRRARLQYVPGLAVGMPGVTVEYGTDDNPVYLLGRKSFVFFRNPRPNATDPETGERTWTSSFSGYRPKPLSKHLSRIGIAVLYHPALQRPPVRAAAFEPYQ